MPTNRTYGWTNESVRLMAGDADPVEALTHRARQLVRRAMDAGWKGPPFDPIALAEFLRIPVLPRDDVRDARTVPVGQGGIRIEFNPNRPPMRVRYSLAHEIAHTLFPDCATLVRNRAAYHELTADDSQLEALCNVGAAEILMPAGSLPRLQTADLSAERIVEMRRMFEVSTEALAIRLAKMADEPRAAFCASRTERGNGAGRLRLDYVIGSPTWIAPFRHGTPVPEASAMAGCVAIGFTASGREQWGEGPMIGVECVGIPPYPGRRHPRVVGILTFANGDRAESLLAEVRGDATEPRGTGPRIIAHVVNDATPNWGGGGFAANLRRKFPAVQQDFRAWAASSRGVLALGRSHYTALDNERGVFHMVAQHGYGDSARPRLRYTALEECLENLGKYAARRSASVHMPRIGTGQAGGSWDVIRDMISEAVNARGVGVTVYIPPDRVIAQPQQTSLAFGHSR